MMNSTKDELADLVYWTLLGRIYINDPEKTARNQTEAILPLFAERERLAREDEASELLMINPECQACKANIDAQSNRLSALQPSNKEGK